MSDAFRFHTLDELRGLTTEELRALWELVPTDRQRAYKAAYEREVRAAHADGSDDLERQVATELLKRYAAAALVPVGARWAQTPGRVQEAAQQGLNLNAPEDALTPSGGKPSAKVLMGLAAAVIIFIGLAAAGRSPRESNTRAEVTEEATATPTPQISPTPTPLALEDQDAVIEGGDRGREAAYPVSLQLGLSGQPPRVWVVQRRRVETSEWHYEDNPDTASYLAGMVVRPVIGIPWSADNAAAFEQIGPGTPLTLTLNTGAVLTFTFAARTEVLRSDTRIFRQLDPGLVLLLIGQTDAEGLPTATRTMITAAYAPEQELSRTGALISVLLPPAPLFPTLIPTAAATAIPLAGLEVQVIALTHSPGRVNARLRLYNGGTQPIALMPEDLWLALGYAEQPQGPRLPAEGLAPFELLPGQAADLDLVWPWTDEPYGLLGVGDWRFGLDMSG